VTVYAKEKQKTGRDMKGRQETGQPEFAQVGKCGMGESESESGSAPAEAWD
jgi:hypothetical protein